MHGLSLVWTDLTLFPDSAHRMKQSQYTTLNSCFSYAVEAPSLKEMLAEASIVYV